ncbi:E7 [Peromyscus papillomavirus 1]|uniref:Protein E7 n=1 Tax=Peromyscus papillomavirus 1 TaxID=1074206 RepID=G1C9I4_9PAPI|nr:E7 [Peromyscus papillomavirus 1]AEM05817.1 E7 [Peromyscus papillomavirus 1]
MIGPEATLRDIVLEESPPETVSLYCDETLSEEEEEEEAESISPYRVYAPCYRCDRSVRLVVSATENGIRGLEKLLLGDVSIVCPSCAVCVRPTGHHGGQA